MKRLPAAVIAYMKETEYSEEEVRRYILDQLDFYGSQRCNVRFDQDGV